ncbi:hypothetical protein [Streptomyces sp. NRRL B-24484]|uniref:hypothetical protein n=1 Tax=Streptomyces sp. NRRL B-24484 TaxID=1463833 RepID=UPI0013316073|nr:hypothetical protein [Streptomyces sp. NRRL B-24484]
MFSKRSVAASVLCAVLAAGATACGGDGGGGSGAAARTAAAPAASSASPVVLDLLSADEIAAKTHSAMAALSSVRVDGSISLDGQRITMHLSSDKRGNCTGTVSGSATGALEIRRTGGKGWIRADEATWRKQLEKGGASPQQAARAASLFKDRFLTGFDDQQMPESAAMCNVIKGMFEDTGEDQVSKGIAGRTNGVKTISLTSVSDGKKLVLHVATEGTPYLIRMETTEGDPGGMDFGAFDKPFTVEVPPADQVVDFSVFKEQLKPA